MQWNLKFEPSLMFLIITNKKKRDSCPQLCKQLQILTLPSQYILSLIVFVANNRGLFLSNSEIHDINTRNNYKQQLPTTNLTLVQSGALYCGNKIYNHLPHNIKALSNDLKHFKSKLKAFHMEHTLYKLKEFYQLTSTWLQHFCLDFIIFITENYTYMSNLLSNILLIFRQMLASYVLLLFILYPIIIIYFIWLIPHL